MVLPKAFVPIEVPALDHTCQEDKYSVLIVVAIRFYSLKFHNQRQKIKIYFVIKFTKYRQQDGCPDWNGSSYRLLSWRPSELAATENMEMEMVDTLTSVFAVVDDNSIAIGESLFLGDLSGGQKEFSENGFILQTESQLKLF